MKSLNYYSTRKSDDVKFVFHHVSDADREDMISLVNEHE